MSFVGRLRLFFLVIAAVPVAAMAVVLVGVLDDSATGKADARLEGAKRTSAALHAELMATAQEELRRVSNHPEFRRALAAGRFTLVSRAARRVADRRSASLSVDLRPGDEPVRAPRVALATAVLRDGDGRLVGRMGVSVITPARFARRLADSTGVDVRLVSRGRHLASSDPRAAGARTRPGDETVGGCDYRAAVTTLQEDGGSTVEAVLLYDQSAAGSSATRGKQLIAGLLTLLLVLGMLSSRSIAVSLNRQLEQFLAAARRLGAGHFDKPVELRGNDYFAHLGAEFNAMSTRLADKIEELEGSRRELQATVRRVGEAFASGLDVAGTVELTLTTSLGACGAAVGRAKPGAQLQMPELIVGEAQPGDLEAMTAAEAGAEAAAAEQDKGAGGETGRQVTRVRGESAFAMSAWLRTLAVDGSTRELGVLTIARSGEDFTDEDRQLFAYLASQAAISIENAELHAAVQRQAITDARTGLYNLRHFETTLDAELGRARRYGSSVSLVLLDVDDFKRVNGLYGHPQGDLVLSQAAEVLRNLSRELDTPVRYGGEEMALILPETGIEGAALLAERVRTAIAELAIPLRDLDGTLAVTASFGVASSAEPHPARANLVAAADAALYRAKRAGKNRVEAAPDAEAVVFRSGLGGEHHLRQASGELRDLRQPAGRAGRARRGDPPRAMSADAASAGTGGDPVTTRSAAAASPLRA